jgi:hypothetical protein
MFRINVKARRGYDVERLDDQTRSPADEYDCDNSYEYKRNQPEPCQLVARSFETFDPFSS